VSFASACAGAGVPQATGPSKLGVLLGRVAALERCNIRAAVATPVAPTRTIALRIMGFIHVLLGFLERVKDAVDLREIGSIFSCNRLPRAVSSRAG
jgi:hypothetical protein